MKNSKTNKMHRMRLGLVCLALFSLNMSKAQFTSGNLVVLQVSDGVSSFTNTGNAVILREFTPAGATGFSVNVPTTGTNALVVSGAATSEGALSLSSNNKYLVFAGYATTTSNTISLASSTTIPRAIAVIDAGGNYAMAASSSSFHLGNNIRSAASDGNNNYWSAGGNDGTDYFGTASATTNVQNGITNTRCVNIFSGNLYFSTGSGTKGIYKVGSALPTASSQTNAIVIDETGIGSGTQSPYGFYFNPSQTVCYVTDDRSVSNGGGIQKWVYAASTWSLVYTLGTGSASTVGARAVVADFSGTTAIVYATTAESTNNRIIAIADAGSTSAATTIATSTTNAIFRGIAFSPCNTPSISSISSSATLCANQTLSLSASANSASSLTYMWSGAGTIASPTSSSSTVSGAATGNYTFTATNGCGSTSSTVSVTVIPNPTLSVNASTTSICAGTSVSLTVSGASTYLWNTTSTSSLTVVSPTSNTTYSVTGTTNNCSATASVAIVANPIPALNAASVTVCSGQPATLTASGANTYSWNTGSTSGSFVVTPTVTTNYTVTGTSLAGCMTTLTTQIVVTSSPAIVVNSSTVCAGSSATLTAGGANTFTWSTGAFTNSIVVSPLTNTVYSISGSLAGCAGIATNTAAVSVNALPVLSISGSTSVCQGSSVSNTLSGAVSYSLNGISVPSTVTLSPPVSGSYSVLGTSSLGCTSMITSSITVLPAPVISAAGNTLTCLLSSFTQTLSGAVTYSMNGVATPSVISVNPGASTTYTFSGTSGSGCVGMITKSITVAPLPVIAVTGNTQICSGSSITQTLSGATSYSWNGNATSSIVTLTPTLTTNYIVTGTDNNGCTSSTARKITVNALPVLMIASQSPTSCVGENVTLTASGATTYSWSGLAATATISVNPTVTTTYSVTGTSSANCSSSGQFVQNVSLCTSLEESKKELTGITLYPNPASRFITLENLKSDKTDIRVLNALGHCVLTETSGAGQKMMDVSSLNTGVYFVQIISGGKTAVKKLIIE